MDDAPKDDVADAPEDAEAMSDGSQDGSGPAPVDVPDHDDGGAVRMSRHPPGTRKVWEGTWFYAAQTPGWLDVKMHMKHPLRRPGTGMGSEWMSRSVTVSLQGAADQSRPYVVAFASMGDLPCAARRLGA